MASSSSSKPGAAKRLQTSTASTLALCNQLAASLDTIYKDPSSAVGPSTDLNIVPLDLARDAATLVRAHATKLSLLLLNEPFTPSAVADVLQQLLAGGPLLGLASAAEACDPARYTAFFRKELAWRARRVLLSLVELVGKIPQHGVAGGAGDKSSLPATGILWAACDDVVALVGGGIGGYFVKSLEEWQDTLKDVSEELRDWGDEEPDGDDDDNDDNDDDDDDNDDKAHEPNTDIQDTASSTQAMLDDFMSAGQAIPLDDPHSIRPRLESTLRRVRLVVLLYQAISKRRLRKLPPLPPSSTSNLPQRLDEAAQVLGALPDAFGDLASAFYDMEPAPIDRAAEDCFVKACAAGELLRVAWDGGEDEFSEWTEKFKAEIKKS
ncbi:Armadillo-type fold [Cordyceps militaris]|uniref:Armadillo-type fold n=1 Tax=Cordyceps militaris TaxID=73501 RepID=A0A2H4SN40_CORMI|nr:Armadillo-type fold [Cordyceps militaris]